jgi:hypothetical protein
MINVPLDKGVDFSKELLDTMSNALSDLYLEHGTLPDLINFQGLLGREVLSFIKEQSWDFNKFNPSYLDGPNQIVFKYTTPLKQVEERGSITPDASLHNRTIQGIPDSNTMSKIVGAYAGGGFSIQREIRPELKVKLLRKK